MTTTSDESVDKRALDQVRRMVLDALRPHAARVRLFGSRARGYTGVTSDIDVAVEPAGGPLPREVMSRLRDQLFESSVPRTVDIVDLATVDTSLRQRILSEAVRWSD